MKTDPKTLQELPIGARLLYRAKDDWRTAVVSRVDEEKVTLIVCSPTGRTYRLKRGLDTRLLVDGEFLILEFRKNEDWRENFSDYDNRW